MGIPQPVTQQKPAVEEEREQLAVLGVTSGPVTHTHIQAFIHVSLDLHVELVTSSAHDWKMVIFKLRASHNMTS